MEALNNPINGLSFAPEWAGTNVYLACQSVSNQVESLYEVERASIESAGELRRKTFSSGRACARAALAEAGLPPSALPKADDGSVHWPAGVIGSLSHTNEWAVAAVAVTTMSKAHSLGCDLERIKPLESGVLNLIATHVEQAELNDAGSQPWHAMALFSMKESIYKCLSPSFGQFFGFHAVELTDMAGGRPQLRIHSEPLRAHCTATEIELRLAVTPEHVFTLAWRNADR